MNTLSKIVNAVLKIFVMLCLATIGIFAITYGYEVAMNIHRLPGFLLFSIGGIFIGFAFLVGFGGKRG